MDESMLDKLKEYLSTHTAEEVQKDWDKSELHDGVGPTMEEYEEYLKIIMKLNDK